jgi:predicted molibdopterin-dependent oxidoreductase YjgC
VPQRARRGAAGVPREGAELDAEILKRAGKRLLFSLKEQEADVCFPLSTWIEKEGTVVSAGDRVQRLTKGLTFEPTLLTERVVLDRLHAALDPEFQGADTAAQALARLAEAEPAFQGLTWKVVGPLGSNLAKEEARA